MQYNYFLSEIHHSNKLDYYTSFGMVMPGRNNTSIGAGYRYGFNGKEKDDEIKGNGNSLDFGARIYDSRLGRWLACDPLAAKYPNMSPYCFVGNMPIFAIDPNGRDIFIVVTNAKSGKTEIQKTNMEYVISKMASSQMGDELIQKYVNNPNEDVYITIGTEKENSMGTTWRTFTEDGKLTNPETAEIGTHTIFAEDKLPEFEGVEINADKKNYFIVLDEDEYGKSELNSELKIKEGAKVLGHEMGAHLKDKEQSRKDEEHDDWGQKLYGTYEAVKGSKAEKFNKEIDKSNQSSEKYKSKDLGRGKYKLEEKK